MIRRSLISALLFVSMMPFASTTQATIPPAIVKQPELKSIELPKGFQYPNGITRAKDGTLYVGSVLSGRILRIRPNGQIDTVFPGNNEIFAVTSLRLDEPRGILWGASPDVLGTPQANGQTVRRPHRIFAMDIRSGRVLRVVMLPDGGFGNDLAIDPQGGIYVTDSTRPRIHYLAPGATQLQTWAEDDRFRTRLRFGLSGIARRADGVLYVTMYSDGKLFKVTPQTNGKPAIVEVPLPRKIDGADAIQLAGDGALIIVEGGIESGNGQLLQFKEGQELKVLASGMNLPVNLAISASRNSEGTAGNQIWLTESLFRHRLVPGREQEVPDRFFVRYFLLPR